MKNNYKHSRVFAAICILCLTCALKTRAQEDSRTITGTVSDDTGPLLGASILIKNTNKGTTSDIEGHYAIIAKPSDTLVFSYLGLQTVEIPVNSKTNINVSLLHDETALSEVVINAGYYKVSDRERTGNIAKITSVEIEKQNVINPLEAIQGRLPGVDIVPFSGTPGGGIDIKIRGQNSIFSGNQPLFIIDGIPYDNISLDSQYVSGTVIPGGISPLNALNPDSIDSIEILKDADATAIYGSRGSNGVILITTKKGKSGRTIFTAGSTTGAGRIIQKHKLLNTEQYLKMREQAFANDGIPPEPDAYDINGTWDKERYTDWQKEFIGGTALTKDFNLGLSGGDQFTHFLINGLFHTQTTVFPGDYHYDKITFNSGFSHSDKADKFKVSFSSAYAIEKNLLPADDLTAEALSLPPNAPALYDEEGNLNWENNTWTNPMAALKAEYSNNSKTLLGNLTFSYTLFKNLNAEISTGYRYTDYNSIKKNPHTIHNPSYGLDGRYSHAYLHSGGNKSLIVEPKISWTGSFDKHNLNILIGSTFQDQTMEKLTLLPSDYKDDSFLGNLSGAARIDVLGEEKYQYKFHSFFARLNYGFNEKLFLNLTGRRDGSSRFSKENTYGNFGAVGAAYIFSEDLNLDWMNFGKIRGSFGLTGNDQINDYQYLQNYGIVDASYDGNLGLEPLRLYNPGFRWEKNFKREIALELGLFNKLSASLAYYNNRSSNQLIDYSLPATTGFTSIQANLNAVVENTGVEFALDASVFNKDQLKWTTSVNLTLPKNRLVSFPGLKDSPYSSFYEIGHSINIDKLYHVTGVNPETGMYEFEDYNNDGMLSSLEDRQYVADLSPKMLAGLSNSVSFKKWSLDIFLQYVNRQGYNELYNRRMPGTMSNQPVTILNSWQNPGDNVHYQQFSSGNNYEVYEYYERASASNLVISDASFIRLKSLNLSYNLPLKQNISSCRVSLIGQNLLTFTKFKGADPEHTPGFIPQLKSLALQVKLQL